MTLDRTTHLAPNNEADPGPLTAVGSAHVHEHDPGPPTAAFAQHEGEVPFAGESLRSR